MKEGTAAYATLISLELVKSGTTIHWHYAASRGAGDGGPSCGFDQTLILSADVSTLMINSNSNLP
jgi:hypothetical protein